MSETGEAPPRMGEGTERTEGRRMPRAVMAYVRVVDRLSDYVGVAAMTLVFLMIGVLLLDAVTRNVLQIPLHWCVEVAQFTLLAYFFLGGAMTLKNDDHVRMDLVYQRLSPRGKARMDLVTSFCLLFFLSVMLIGSISSLRYAIGTDERRFSMWNPSMIPIKVLLVACLVLMLLQAVSLIFKHVAALREGDAR
ncbi:MAG TPA: TRAP transporter small permease subunit [Mesorhizobium sp.]|jgi:TRAP-type mannitol/chloroaromatic compound transport system permease small subunit|nr:TRAP transporter small permease subunit [Mesorhizobium sp.]